MSVRRAMVAVGWTLAASAALSACCDSPWNPRPEPRARWNFETPCTGGASCDFVAEQGSADVTSGFHPGERILLLAPNSTAAARLDWGEPARAYPVTFSLLARCDANTLLVATFEVGAAPAAVMGERDTSVRAPIEASETWRGATGEFMSSFAGRAARFRLTTVGPGVCQVDSIQLFDRYGIAPNGC